MFCMRAVSMTRSGTLKLCGKTAIELFEVVGTNFYRIVMIVYNDSI